MNSELEVLKKIWENNKETHVRLISSETKLGIDYTRYICNCLLKKGEIKPVKKSRDWYKITTKGEKELKTRGIIKPETSKKISAAIEKVVYYLPRHSSAFGSNKFNQKNSIKNTGGKKLKGNLIAAQEKKLDLGQGIVRAVSFLTAQIRRENKRG